MEILEVFRTRYLESESGLLSVEHFGRITLDVILAAFLMYVFFAKPRRPQVKPLTAKEKQQLIDEWEPTPLHPALDPRIKKLELDPVPTIAKEDDGAHVILDNGQKVLNLCRSNYHGLLSTEETKQAADAALHKYGTGSCGPRGFYGTIDVHMFLEKRIQEYMKSEDCIIYSYGFATSSSCIPAFAGRSDFLVVDDGVHQGLQTGCRLSRAKVFWYKHNDMNDLENVLQQIQKIDKQTKRKLNRRFIVFEGLSINYGDIAPLDSILALKKKYLWRLVMDDSIGIGSIGKSLRGTCDHHNVAVTDVDMVVGNLSSTVSSAGGFVCCSEPMVFHQRLNAAGYVYSASLPPLLATAATAGFSYLDDNSARLSKTLRSKITVMRDELKRSCPSEFIIEGDALSPVVHFKLDEISRDFQDRLQEEEFFQAIVDSCLEQGVMLTRAKYNEGVEYNCPPPSIRISVSSVISDSDLVRAMQILCQSAKKQYELSQS